jgi:hypothetical protein
MRVEYGGVVAVTRVDGSVAMCVQDEKALR